jgi:putative ABC transport system ATP-binding protein
MQHTPLISISHVFKEYNSKDTPVVALQDVSLQINEGEFVSIVGPSGSGKSTLLHILGALDRPSTGVYTLDGIDVSTLDDSALSKIRRTKIGFVFQVFNLIHQLNVLENVVLPLQYDGMDDAKAHEKAMECIDRVGLLERVLHTPSELSGGERQRVAIARSLAISPSVLLADEPTGNLDSVTGEQILALFEELRDEGHTVLVVTHDKAIAQRADRIIALQDGEIVQEVEA